MIDNVKSLTNKPPKRSNRIFYELFQQFDQSSLKQNEENSTSSEGDTSSIVEPGERSKLADTLQNSNALNAEKF